MLHPHRDACTTCEAAIARNAILAHRLRKTIAALHATHRRGDDPIEWSRCGHPSCVAAWESLEARKAPHGEPARRTV